MGSIKSINPRTGKLIANPQAAAHDYNYLVNKPQINGHELVGEETSESLGLQRELTAGDNITIDENGRISAAGGVTNYEELNNLPRINGFELMGNKSADDLGLQGKIYFIVPPAFPTEPYKVGDIFIYNSKIYRYAATAFLDIAGTYIVYNRIGRNIKYSTSSPPIIEELVTVSPYDVGDLYVKTRLSDNSLGNLSGEVYICGSVSFGKTYSRMQYAYTWIRIDTAVTSATQNQDGSITLVSFNGGIITIPGSTAYTLTEQEKQDIAAIVLESLNGAT